MRLDLNRMGVEHCAQTFFNNLFREGFPIEVRIGDQVSVVVADGSVHLGEDLHGLDGFNDACKADGHIGEFLADGRGGSRLTVSARKHRDLGPLVSVVGDDTVDLFKEGHQSLAALHQHQSMARVVDVFTRAGEVHEFSGVFELFVVSNLSFDPIFNGLDVVIGGLFDFFHRSAVVKRKMLCEAAQERFAVIGEMRQFRKTGFGECNQPFDFNAYACVHEGVFGKDPAQGIALAGIAAVERRESGKRIKRHDWRFLKVQKGTKTGRQLRSERTEIGLVREIAPF